MHGSEAPHTVKLLIDDFLSIKPIIITMMVLFAGRHLLNIY